ncbi:AraC family transcriptional regulator [Niallia endozanthoxylica]|uniref:AraC family transcriptional regulator n=1 Tax=Niallia endozanthoxylica TaxID=2036016 RepID=A0A5J5HRA1_9BACI|nr:AraC family transcriptional regulator [Niallia endozanthoxylica]KAA9022527.1 AraC family transcriptional regulator [Niallia endozanthoxylica]
MEDLLNLPFKRRVLDEWITAFYRMQGVESYTFQFHSHHEYEIYFFCSGECKYLINNRIYELEPGDIILLDGMTLHKANPWGETIYTRSALHFSPTWLTELISTLAIPILLDPFRKLNNPLLRTRYDENGQYVDGQIKKISGILSDIDEELQRTGKKNELLEAEVKIELVQLLLAIYKMSQKELAQITSKKTEKEVHAEEIASWIRDHYTEKISLDIISSKLNLSKYYISHVFKEVTGFTVMEYVMGCRLNQVKFLLEMEPGLTLAEVAHASGFESIAHFSRYFKEKVGITPSRYRKINSQRAAKQ